MYKKGQIISNKEYTQAAIWCNKNAHFITKIDGNYIIDCYPEPTEEEIAAELLNKAKSERAEFVSKIVVEVDGMKFDGDETSQDRMARSCVALNDGETVQWVLADNTIAHVTKEQLRQALRLSGEAQTAIWADPYLTDNSSEKNDIIMEGQNVKDSKTEGELTEENETSVVNDEQPNVIDNNGGAAPEDTE